MGVGHDRETNHGQPNRTGTSIDASRAHRVLAAERVKRGAGRANTGASIHFASILSVQLFESVFKQRVTLQAQHMQQKWGQSALL